MNALHVIPGIQIQATISSKGQGINCWRYTPINVYHVLWTLCLIKQRSAYIRLTMERAAEMHKPPHRMCKANTTTSCWHKRVWHCNYTPSCPRSNATIQHFRVYTVRWIQIARFLWSCNQLTRTFSTSLPELQTIVILYAFDPHYCMSAYVLLLIIILMDHPESLLFSLMSSQRSHISGLGSWLTCSLQRHM